MIETLGTLIRGSGQTWPAMEARGESIENPRTSFDRVLELAGGHQRSFAGKVVSEQAALQISAAWACCRVIAHGVAMLDLQTFRRDGKRRQLAEDHYLWRLLMKRANPHMSAFRFKRLMTLWAAHWGNAYALIETSANGRVMALHPFHPARTRLDRGSRGLVYTFHHPDGTVAHANVPADLVLHLRGLETDDSGQGLSVVAVARQSMGVALAIEEYGGRLMAQGCMINGVLQYPGALSDKAQANLRASWEKQYSGTANAGKIAVLEEGAKFQPLSMNPEDAQFLESRKFSVPDICRWYGVPPHMVADLERATFSNIEHLSLEFVTHTLGPWLENWEQEGDNSLLSESEGRTTFLRFRREELVLGDYASRAQANNTYRQGGVLTGNEIREDLGYNPHDDGDDLLVNGNMVPASVAAQAQPAGPKPTASEEQPQ